MPLDARLFLNYDKIHSLSNNKYLYQFLQTRKMAFDLSIDNEVELRASLLLKAIFVF